MVAPDGEIKVEMIIETESDSLNDGIIDKAMAYVISTLEKETKSYLK